MNPLMFLRAVPPRVWGWLIVILLALASFAAYTSHERTIGANREKAAALQVKIVHDSIRVVEHDTVVLHDTIRLTRTLARYDTVRSVLNVHDTIAVERFVATADSTVRACRETVSAFALSCAAKDTLIGDLRARLAIGVAPPRSGVSFRERLGWALVGVALDEGARRWRH